VTARVHRRAASIAAMSLAIVVLAPIVSAQAPARRVLVAVFAHPDDEIVVGPMLSRSAREDVDVRLVLATNGDRGRRITKIPAGEALGRARAAEATCSTGLSTRPGRGGAREPLRTNPDIGSIPDRPRSV
jgi:hypothetical protein